MTFRTRVQDIQNAKARRNALQSLDLLHYNLRGLLHRNDTMGMAASIESRFPFLDTQLVKLAVNLSYNCKIRFSPTALEREHPFFRDKWMLRKVAERYLPRALSHRPKKPFPVNAYSAKRMRIAPAFFDQSYVTELLGLSSRTTRYLLEKAEHDLKLKLLQLEVWAHVCVHNLPANALVTRLREYLSIT